MENLCFKNSSFFYMFKEYFIQVQLHRSLEFINLIANYLEPNEKKSNLDLKLTKPSSSSKIPSSVLLFYPK